MFLNVKTATGISVTTPQVAEAVNNKDWGLLRAFQMLPYQNSHLYSKNRIKQSCFSAIMFSTLGVFSEIQNCYAII